MSDWEWKQPEELDNWRSRLYQRFQFWLLPTTGTFLASLIGFGLTSLLLDILWSPSQKLSDLGSIFEAQAAMTAIFLAAMVFIVEGVKRHDGIDDYLYEHFLSQARARWVFALSIWLMVGTTSLFVGGPVTGWWHEVEGSRGELLAGC